jgi:glycine/D-amino acid oxidase-like deaminating enzyme
VSAEPAKRYAGYSFWLETAGDELTPRPPLRGAVVADVAILGAGFSGLWTAYYLQQHTPSLRIALVEAEIAGYGASGRNGGWCYSGFPVSLRELTRRYGADAARRVECAMRDTVSEIERVCAAEGIDAHFARGGALRLARGAQQLPAIQSSYETARELGLGDGYALLDVAQTAERIRVTDAMGALVIRSGASVHPGRLVRGLARVVERRGATIYEQSPVSRVEAAPPSPALVTAEGRVEAETVVLAGEAYLTRLRGLDRQLLPLYSHIVLTEPLTEAQWEEIGWSQRECVSSSVLSIDYLNRTADGRILFGSRGEPYHLGSRIEDRFDSPPAVRARLEGLLREWFPSLADTAITHAWGGPVGMPRDWMPSVRLDRAAGIATARGYTGQGVATTNLAGRILADMITGQDSPLLELPLAGHRSPRWEPEPLRWLGVRYIQSALARVDRHAARTGRAPSGRTPAERLGRH